MRINEISGNIHSELSRYLEDQYVEDVSDMVRHIAGWLRTKGVQPLSWKKGQTSFGSTMFLTKYKDHSGEEKWLAFDDQMGVGDISSNEPDPSSYG